ncbi:MAG: deoxynucleoside kinase, partial [Aquitalea sp.]|nr:deoxynucleoside kinase [Aquitalea sp.]
AAYSEFFHQYEAAPLLIVNTDHLELVDGNEDFELLLRCISEMRGQRSYFNKSV